MKKRIWALLLTITLLSGCTPFKSAETPTETQPPAVSAEETPEDPTVPPPPEITAPEEFTAILKAGGISLETLRELECGQLVTVTATGVTAQIELYILEDSRWCRQEALSCTGFVGLNGVSHEKLEGDKTTPAGLFPVGQAFYIHEAPQTGLPAFQITGNTYWVDDPNSLYYNQHIEGTENKDWNSAEHMLSYGAAYEYGFVIGYNTEAVPYAGSAIFFHVGSRATAGCVATGRDLVLGYLAVLDPANNPYILIN